MSEKVNIHEEIFAICDKLGLNAENVRRLDFTPTEVVAEVFLRNESGSKYVETRVFQVQT